MPYSGHRVLVCAPFGRDAQSIAKLLTRKNYGVLVCLSLRSLAAQLDEKAGAAILTEESLSDGLPELQLVLQTQAPWSDIPILLLTARKKGPASSSTLAFPRASEISANLIVIERPLSSVSLLSAVNSALRSRRKQFEMRSSLEQIANNTGELRRRNSALAQSQIALKESEAKFLGIANSIDQMVWSTLPDGHHDYYNKRWYDFTGVTVGSTDGEGWNGMFHPEDQQRAWGAWRHSLQTGEPYQIEYRLRHHSGEYRWVLGRAQAVRDEDNKIVRWYGTCTEIQEIIAAREVLSRTREELETLVEHRTADLKQAHEQLRQSQKMEAVGQLTGGIAHDFNNLLTGVLGSLSIIKRRIDTNRLEDLDRFIAAATTSAQRAAGLTHRLLAFSRLQSLDSKPININDLIQSLTDLIARTISEQIKLRIELAEGLPAGIADSNQLESAILNLVINARDAMPGGGVLTVETRGVTLDETFPVSRPDAETVQYVMIAVSDTGVGMAPDVIDKAFEPFFTTKPVGQGTGLGLSMVYGFIKQSGGQVRIDSVVGTGTSVKIYLPVSEIQSTVHVEAAIAARTGRGQTVLVVEDDLAVRLLICDVLTEMGYGYLEAGDASAAVPVLASSQHIDLLISDVGLPGMNGRQLAEVARNYRPKLPVIFVTGYAENAAIRSDFLGTNMSLVTKPFSLEELSKRIDSLLAEQRSPEAH